MQVMRRSQAKKVADNCQYIEKDDGCPICWHIEESEVCCAYCINLTKPECSSKICKMLIKEEKCN